jgi:hypothetical protein
MKTRPIHFALLLAAIALPACQLGMQKDPKLTGSGMDMFTPVKMRLHPLSRVVNESGTAIEGRIELTDQFGDINKGVGTVTFDLFNYETLIPNHQGDKLNSWSFDFNNPDANKKHWDGITRTYLFNLPLPENTKTKPRFLLTATLTLPNGTKLTDDIPLAK